MAEVRIVVRPYASSLPLGFFAFGVGELLCAIVAFLARDAFGATGLGMFSTSWLALGLANLRASQDALSRTVGLYEFGFAVAIVLLAVAAFGGKPLIGVILLAATVRSALAGVYQFGAPHAFETAAGWTAVGIFCVAMYGGIAFLLEDVQKRAVVPVFRRGSSRESFEGDLQAQLSQLGDEAGVRQTL